MSSIPCLAWAKRGATVGRPQKIKLTEDELANLVEETEDKIDDSPPSSPLSNGDENNDDDDDDDDIEKKYDLSDYDSDETTDTHGLGLKSLIWHGQDISNKYLVDDDDEESEDAEIQPDDNILAIGRVKTDIFGLEAYVYNEASSSLYCHHDTIMASFPLAMEWVGYDPGEDGPGNLLAVGTVEPRIELWDLDVINTLEPAFVLGGGAKKGSVKKSRMSYSGHTDAVLALSWNTLQQNALASGSADFTVGLWDLEEGEMITSIDHHDEKVQALQWHPFEKELLLSGSIDKTSCLFDCRHSKASHKAWNLPGEVEKVTWNSQQPFYFMASTDNGFVYCFDVRSQSPVFTVKAHKEAVTGLAISSELPGCMVTSSTDQLIKVWDISNNEPDLVCRVNLGIGEIHSMAPCPDSGFIYAIGAETDLRIFHLKTSEKVLRRWNLEVVPGKTSRKSKLVDSDVDTSDTCEDSDENPSGESSFESDSDECHLDNKKKQSKLVDVRKEQKFVKQINKKQIKSTSGYGKMDNKQLTKSMKLGGKNSNIVDECSNKQIKKKTNEVDGSCHELKKRKKKKNKSASRSDPEEVDDRLTEDNNRREKKKSVSNQYLNQVSDISPNRSCKEIYSKKKKMKGKPLTKVVPDHVMAEATDVIGHSVSPRENDVDNSLDPDDFVTSESERHVQMKVKKRKKKSKKKCLVDDDDDHHNKMSFVKKKCKT
ncbi:hypothetical protein LSH36_455g03018 [Paralvinella palmiformis]|uniref:Periodic tryptophan protein 1 homolog n=1 Tax=Paralvinella palmiformis TaxID=53620 RepID=A0AAD9MXD4_9ANNE|nr:hypothetical protein LSH36_455g03018 [Paralvinella palmiformis]